MLMDAGRGGGEPAAIISKATTASQKTIVSTLANIAKDTANANLEPPAIFVVGRIVQLREGLDWLGAISGKQLQADPLGMKRLDVSA